MAYTGCQAVILVTIVHYIISFLQLNFIRLNVNKRSSLFLLRVDLYPRK